jgi:hypothetical protein
MFRGAMFCIGGILVTVLSYLAAWTSPLGGTYVVAWGAILFGAIRFIQGWRELRAPPPSDKEMDTDTGYEAIAIGTRLEMAGRVPEALAIYQKVAEEHPDTDAARDARKCIESLQAKLD